MTRLALVTRQTITNIRAGHRPANALRLALLNQEISQLERRMK